VARRSRVVYEMSLVDRWLVSLPSCECARGTLFRDFISLLDTRSRAGLALVTESLVEPGRACSARADERKFSIRLWRCLEPRLLRSRARGRALFGRSQHLDQPLAKRLA
jgi:hypothetical protein